MDIFLVIIAAVNILMSSLSVSNGSYGVATFNALTFIFIMMILVICNQGRR